MGEREGKGKEAVEGLTLGKAGTTSSPPPQRGRNYRRARWGQHAPLFDDLSRQPPEMGPSSSPLPLLPPLVPMAVTSSDQMESCCHFSDGCPRCPRTGSERFIITCQVTKPWCSRKLPWNSGVLSALLIELMCRYREWRGCRCRNSYSPALSCFTLQSLNL